MFFKLYFKKIEFYVKFNIIKIEISKLETNAHFYKWKLEILNFFFIWFETIGLLFHGCH